MAGDTPWTPGPWRVDGDLDDLLIIGRPAWPCRRFQIKGDWEVAKLDDLGFDHPQEAWANARLIASAPEMAELLRDIEESLTADNSHRLLREACRTLLSKITGEA